MSFTYNQVDFDAVDSVSLTGGSITRSSGATASRENSLSQEQKRKQQLIDFLAEEFNNFHEFFDELMRAYSADGGVSDSVFNILGVPDYRKCDNCRQAKQSGSDDVLCMETERMEGGERLYNIIPDTDTVPSFCENDMPNFRFPKNRIHDVDDWLFEIAKTGYDGHCEEQKEYYHQRRQEHIDDDRYNSRYVTQDVDEFIQTESEYIASEIDSLIRGIVNQYRLRSYKSSALKLAWFRYLDDTIQDDYHVQRAEAYLRALDSPHQKDLLPGEGGDRFEKSVRRWVRSIGLPTYERVFKLNGSSTDRKEMDIHTELPTGDRAIFEVFTAGSHSNKDKQLDDYARLLNLAKNVNAEEILLSDGGWSRQRIDKTLLFDLLNTDFTIDSGIKMPGEFNNRTSTARSFERISSAETLNYIGFGPDYAPCRRSQKNEQEIIKTLQSHGYEPRLSVFRSEREFRDGHNFLFCGPTVEMNTYIGDLTLTFHSNRERRFKNGRDEQVCGYGTWHSVLAEMNDNPVAVIEVDEMCQSKLHPGVLGALFEA
jgi:hypothetical protein